MEQLRRAGNLVKQRLGELSASQRMLIASLVVVLGMGLFVVQQYTSSPDMVPLLDASYPAEDQQAAARFLDQQGVAYRQNETGTVMVAAVMRPRLLAQMSQSPGALPSDTTILFNNLIDKQSWTKSDRQNRQLGTIALQNELGHMLSQWKDIRAASVIIDVPVKRALGQPTTVPTAAVSVTPEGSLDQATVDAIAAFVAGARSGLTPDRVRIVDAATGQQRRARSEEQITATTTQELIAQIEQRQQRKIADMLVYIPGVIVTVQAQVDATRRTSKKVEALPDGKGSVALVRSETSMERRDTEPVRSAEPGVRPNTEADIYGSGGATATSVETTEETDFDTLIGTVQESIVDPRGSATKINAVVNVPRSYFESIWSDRQRREGGEEAAGDDEAAAPPSDAELAPIVEAELQRITEDVASVVDTSAQERALEGEVKVSMIPTPPALASVAPTQTGGFLGFGGGEGGAVPPLVKTLALGGLAALALGLVVITAFRANKLETLPDAQDLVGIPKALESETDLIGEVDPADPALAGIELDDASMQDRQVLEQVAGVVAEKPQDAARIVMRWIGEED